MLVWNLITLVPTAHLLLGKMRFYDYFYLHVTIKMFNILTRTNSRPKYFFMCRNSITNQNYEGTVNQYVSIDDQKTMDYIDMYGDSLKIVEVEKKQKQQPNVFPYNDYLNTMLSKIEDGWVMVLDDDDKFMKNEALSIIQKNINEHDENTMFLWKVKIGARIVPSLTLFGKQIRRNEVSNIGFCFHSSQKDKANWIGIRGGDFKCIEKLSEHLKIVWIDDILTCTNNNTGNFGNQRDISLDNENTKKYTAFCNNYIDKSGKNLPDPYLEKVEELQSDAYTVEEIKKNIIGNINEITNSEEKTYVLKESMIKEIAEMLSSAINSKKLYEDIINKRYLENKSIIQRETPSITSTILQQIEKDEKIKSDLLIKKSENSNLNLKEKNLYNIIVLIKNNNLKEKITNYLEKCGFLKNNINFIQNDNNNFNSTGVIEAAKIALQKNYDRVILVHENSLVIKNFKKEIEILCNYPDYESSDVIFCGLNDPFNKLINGNQVSSNTRGRNRNSSKINKKIDIDFDYYISLYKDLQNNEIDTISKATDHWEKYGYDENRIHKRELINFTRSMQTSEFVGVILSRKACLNISECFDESLLTIMLFKELEDTMYVVSPYLFETEKTLSNKKYNINLYNH